MDFIDEYSRAFLLAYAAGIVFLLLFCVERFDQPARKPGSFVDNLVPRHLATHTEFLRAFLIYYFIMWSIYTLVTLAGPQVMQGFAGDTAGFAPEAMVDSGSVEDSFSVRVGGGEDPVWFPLAVVMLLAGVSTRYPVFNSVELIVRRLTHRIIGIPDGIQKLAESLNRARIDLGALVESEQEFIREKYKVATGQELSSISDYYKNLERHRIAQINWIRLKFLFNIIENRRRDLPEAFDANVLAHYPSMWTQIKSSIYELSDDRISEFLGINYDKADEIDKNRFDHLEEKINNTLSDLHAIIAACIAHSTGRNTDLTEVMRALKLMSTPEKRQDLSNAFIAAFFVVFVFIFIIVFATPAVLKLMNYTPTELFPSDNMAAFQWATSSVFLHGAAAFAAWRYREGRQKSWKPMNIRAASIPAAQYLTVMFLAFLAATIGLGLWWFLKELFTGVQPLSMPSNEEFWIPLFGLIGAATGFWVCYSLDVAEREEHVSMGRMLIQAAMQGMTTGGLCFILMTTLPGERITLGFELYAGIVAGLLGLIIGFIIILFVRQLYQQSAKESPEVTVPAGSGQ